LDYKELGMAYTPLAQVKITLKQFQIDTVTNDDETTADVVYSMPSSL
jgi:hypothetical protein